jgi:hypothetical protein
MGKWFFILVTRVESASFGGQERIVAENISCCLIRSPVHKVGDVHHVDFVSKGTVPQTIRLKILIDEILQ